MDQIVITFKDDTVRKHNASFIQIQGNLLIVKTVEGCHMYTVDIIKEVYNSGVPNKINFDQ